MPPAAPTPPAAAHHRRSLVLALLCFAIALAVSPFLVVKARKVPGTATASARPSAHRRAAVCHAVQPRQPLNDREPLDAARVRSPPPHAAGPLPTRRRSPKRYLEYMFSKERALHSAVYFLSLGATLYAAIGLRRTVPTVMCAAVQVMVLGWCAVAAARPRARGRCRPRRFLLGYIPGGMRGLRLLFKAWFAVVKGVVWPCLTRCLPRLCL